MFTRTVKVIVFCTVSKWVQCISMALFTHNAWKIKGAAHKNGEVDGTCKKCFTECNTWVTWYQALWFSLRPSVTKPLLRKQDSQDFSLNVPQANRATETFKGNSSNSSNRKVRLPIVIRNYCIILLLFMVMRLEVCVCVSVCECLCVC